MTTRIRMIGTSVSLVVALVCGAGCSAQTNRSPATPVPTTGDASRPPRIATTVLGAGRSLSVHPNPELTPATVPRPDIRTPNAVTAARAWAIAANSSSYRDPTAGSWTLRSAPFVTGTEAALERRENGGAGGSTWTLIKDADCVTNLRQLTAGTPSRDVPTGPDLRIVNVSAVIAISCATGRVQLTEFAAQLTVRRVLGHWFVADVQY